MCEMKTTLYKLNAVWTPKAKYLKAVGVLEPPKQLNIYIGKEKSTR